MKTKLIIFFLFLTTTMVAQELTVKSFDLAPMDLSAQTNQVLDYNGIPCALVKVELVIPNAEFSGDIVTTVPKTSEYWVYFTEGAERIKVSVPGVLPKEYEFPEPLIKNSTYVLTLTVPSNYVMPVQQVPVVTQQAPEEVTVTEEVRTEHSVGSVSTPKVIYDQFPMFRIQPAIQVGSLMGIAASIGLNFSGFDVELGGVKGLGKEEYYAYRPDGAEIGKAAFDAMALEARFGYSIKATDGLYITPQVGAIMLVGSDELLVENANAISGIAGVRVSYSLARNFALFATPSLCFKLTESDGYKQICEKVDALSKLSGGFNLKVGLSVEF